MKKKKINIVNEISNIEHQNTNSEKNNSEVVLSEKQLKWYNILNQQLDIRDKN